jgi:hypothetical protein
VEELQQNFDKLGVEIDESRNGEVPEEQELPQEEEFLVAE